MVDWPTRATIHLDAVRANYAEALRRSGGREAIAVVKADAYGHGAVPVVRALLAEGCRRFAVVSVDEAVALRDAGVDAPILVLAGVWGPDEAREVFARRLVPVIHHDAHVEWLSAARGAEPLAVHVEVDTGMRRMGAAPDRAAALMAKVRDSEGLTLEGTFTHFARADEPDLDPTLRQLAAFRDVVEEARGVGVDPGQLHAANSAGLLAGKALTDALPELRASRPGLMLYGVLPAPHLEARLRPAMTLRTRVAHVRQLRAGDAVGYSALYRAASATRVATLPIGYEDAVPIAASGRGSVLIRGRRLPIVGRVSMDYTSVDVGSAPVEIGDEVILFGRDEDGAELPVREAAASASTVAYEMLVRVGSRVRREYEGGA